MRQSLSLILFILFTINLSANRYSVADFGAKPNDGKDDSNAIAKALEFCKQHPGATLLFPYGQYDLKNIGCASTIRSET